MEFVFVVPRMDLFPDAFPQGLLPFAAASTGRIEDGVANGTHFDGAHFDRAAQRHGYFMERAVAERSPSLKQVIPYSIVVRDDQVYLLRRTRAGGEARLFDKLSIGVGGHVNPVDAEGVPLSEGRDSRAILDAATQRELSEELDIEHMAGIERIGILNDDSNAVGAVHVGLVQIVRVKGEVRVREKDQLEGRFVSAEELRALQSEGANFETWSYLLVDRLSELCPELELAGAPSLTDPAAQRGQGPQADREQVENRARR